MLAKSSQPASPPIDVPKGCWLIDDGVEVRIGASCVSLGRAALLLIYFLTYLLGGSLLLMFAVHHTILAFGGTPPALPLFGSQPSAVRFPTGQLIGLWLLLAIVFPLGSVKFITYIAMNIAGHVEVTLCKGVGVLFAGVGRIGSTHRFDLGTVRRILVRARPFNIRAPELGFVFADVVIEADRTIHFGGHLNEAQQLFLQHKLTELLELQDVPV